MTPVPRRPPGRSAIALHACCCNAAAMMHAKKVGPRLYQRTWSKGHQLLLGSSSCVVIAEVWHLRATNAVVGQLYYKRPKKNPPCRSPLLPSCGLPSCSATCLHCSCTFVRTLLKFNIEWGQNACLILWCRFQQAKHVKFFAPVPLLGG
jgi:hypothetical protein